jgi:hypothetical protein
VLDRFESCSWPPPTIGASGGRPAREPVDIRVRIPAIADRDSN